MRAPDHPLPADYQGSPVDGSPVFVGHYWMEGTPVLQSPKLACVDWSAAKHGPLVAYRWDGETELDASRFVTSDERFTDVFEGAPPQVPDTITVAPGGSIRGHSGLAEN